MSGAYVSLAVGINNLTGGGITDALGMGGDDGPRGGAAAQKAVDPFSPYRGKLGEMYSGYLTGQTETDITKMPGYSQFEKGVLNPALEASKRSSATSGILRSGNEQIALQNIGQRGYYGFMTDYLNRLATGSGATYSPAEGGQAGVAQGNLQEQAFMQGVGGVAQSLSKIYGGSQQYTPQQFQQQQASTYGSSNAGFEFADPYTDNSGGFGFGYYGN